MSCHALYRSDRFEVASCIGNASRRDPSAMHFLSYEVHFQTDGAYFLHDGPRTQLVDVHHVELRRARRTEVYSRPVVASDRGLSIRFSLAALGVSQLGVQADDSFPTGAVHLTWQRFRELRALRAALERGRDEEEIADKGVTALISRVVRAGRQQLGSRLDHSPRALRHRAAVERAKVYLIEHHHGRPGLASVAAAVDYAPHHFARIFRAATGLTVHAYLTELRLRQAAARLEIGAVNLSGLALDLGFSSQSHFTTTFREYFGCTPGAYRDDRP